LPSGGGPFKGFAFVVVETKEDAERVLRTWEWDRKEVGDGKEEEDIKMEEKEGRVEYETLAKESGFRALS
jgi:hypothetical protein